MAPKRKQTDSGKGKKVSKVQKQEESENEIEASDESNAENDSDDEVSIPEEAGDGLADMMSKILNQNIGSKVQYLQFDSLFAQVFRLNKRSAIFTPSGSGPCKEKDRADEGHRVCS